MYVDHIPLFATLCYWPILTMGRVFTRKLLQSKDKVDFWLRLDIEMLKNKYFKFKYQNRFSYIPTYQSPSVSKHKIIRNLAVFRLLPWATILD